MGITSLHKTKWREKSEGSRRVKIISIGAHETKNGVVIIVGRDLKYEIEIVRRIKNRILIIKLK